MSCHDISMWMISDRKERKGKVRKGESSNKAQCECEICKEVKKLYYLTILHT